jgi:hypothetical protein
MDVSYRANYSGYLLSIMQPFQNLPYYAELSVPRTIGVSASGVGMYLKRLKRISVAYPEYKFRVKRFSEDGY